MRMLAGGAPDRLLDTYHAERHPIERDVLCQSSMLTQMAGAEHGPMKLHALTVLGCKLA